MIQRSDIYSLHSQTMAGIDRTRIADFYKHIQRRSIIIGWSAYPCLEEKAQSVFSFEQDTKTITKSSATIPDVERKSFNNTVGYARDTNDTFPTFQGCGRIELLMKHIPRAKSRLLSQ